MMTIRIGLLILAAIIAALWMMSSGVAADPGATKKAAQFLDAFTKKIRPLDIATNLAWWDANMTGKKEAYKSAGEKLDKGAFGDEDRMPFLTIEADGNPYPQLLEARFDSFSLQAARVAEKQGKKVAVKVN